MQLLMVNLLVLLKLFAILLYTL